MKNTFVLDGRLIDLQFTQAQILFSCCWCFTFCIGILFGHVPNQVHDAARVVPLVVVPAHNLHEGGVQHDASLGIKVKEMGSVLKSVEANVSSVKQRKPFMSLSGVSPPRRSLPGGLFLDLDSGVDCGDVNGRNV